jgi:Fe-S cluster assembly iron-binding protein IscA
MLTLTANVVRKFKEYLETERATDSGIRIFVSSGC